MIVKEQVLITEKNKYQYQFWGGTRHKVGDIIDINVWVQDVKPVSTSAQASIPTPTPDGAVMPAWASAGVQEPKLKKLKYSKLHIGASTPESPGVQLFNDAGTINQVSLQAVESLAGDLSVWGFTFDTPKLNDKKSLTRWAQNVLRTANNIIASLPQESQRLWTARGVTESVESGGYIGTYNWDYENPRFDPVQILRAETFRLARMASKLESDIGVKMSKRVLDIDAGIKAGVDTGWQEYTDTSGVSRYTASVKYLRKEVTGWHRLHRTGISSVNWMIHWLDSMQVKLPNSVYDDLVEACEYVGPEVVYNVVKPFLDNRDLQISSPEDAIGYDEESQSDLIKIIRNIINILKSYRSNI